MPWMAWRNEKIEQNNFALEVVLLIFRKCVSFNVQGKRRPAHSKKEIRSILLCAGCGWVKPYKGRIARLRFYEPWRRQPSLSRRNAYRLLYDGFVVIPILHCFQAICQFSMSPILNPQFNDGEIKPHQNNYYSNSWIVSILNLRIFCLQHA